jgi:outer membrane receptor protein involved in Fe transport
MQSVNWVSQLKLRASYGAVGNQAISPYTTLGTVNSYQMLFGDGSLQTGYLSTSQLSNPNLKWETTNSLDFGLDFDFLQGRISGAIDYYDTHTRDLLISKSINQSLGYSSVLDNLGEVQNRGLEVLLNTVPIRTDKLTWAVDVTWSANRNKLLKINGEVDAAGNPVNDLNNNWFVGKPINVYYNYIFDGIWQTGDNIADSHMPAAKPGDIRVKDLNGDNTITSADRDLIYRDPKWYGSIGSTLKFAGFDLYMDFYKVQGGQRANAYLYDFNSGGSLSGKTNGVKVNYWTPENPSNEAPRPRYNGTINYFSALGYQDASYLRMRTASIGYTFPAALTSQIKVQQFRVFATATNVFTQSVFKSFSPEVAPGGYPEPRVITAGVNISL